MTDDNVPSWARAAAMIEGITLSDVPHAPCKRCGRQIPLCVHPQAVTRPNGSISCFGCATLLHGSPQRGETLLCSVCGLLDVMSIQEPFTPLNVTVEEE
jgi:hypothetical protein